MVERISPILKLEDKKIKKYLEFINLSQEDIERIKALGKKLKDEDVDEIFEVFLNHLLNIEDTRKILLEKVKEPLDEFIGKLKKHFKETLKGTYDLNYVERRLKVGFAHRRAGVEPIYFIGAFEKLFECLLNTIKKYFTIEESIDIGLSVRKIMLFNATISLESYFFSMMLDPLTSIMGRELFKEFAYREISNAKRYKYPLSFIMFDVDNFKCINDTYGHQIGDKVLKHVAESVSKTMRKGDLLARWGGDEFVALMPHVDGEQAKKSTERWLKVIEALVINNIKITISVGIAQLEEEDDYQSLLRKADEAMYEAKRRGKGQIVFLQSPLTHQRKSLTQHY